MFLDASAKLPATLVGALGAIPGDLGQVSRRRLDVPSSRHQVQGRTLQVTLRAPERVVRLKGGNHLKNATGNAIISTVAASSARMAAISVMMESASMFRTSLTGVMNPRAPGLERGRR